MLTRRFAACLALGLLAACAPPQEPIEVKVAEPGIQSLNDALERGEVEIVAVSGTGASSGDS